MVQTTNPAMAGAAKAEVVSIILWFRVRIPVGPPFSQAGRRGPGAAPVFQRNAWRPCAAFDSPAALHERSSSADFHFTRP